MAEEESVLVLYAAGLKNFEKRPINLRNFTDKGLEVPEIFKHLDQKYHAKRKTSKDRYNMSVPKLMEICREVVRDELIDNNTKNLFHLVPMLPLPEKVREYLLYGASLQFKNDEDNDFSSPYPTFHSSQYQISSNGFSW